MSVCFLYFLLYISPFQRINEDKIMEDQSSDQAEILERVRHLSGETAAINDIFSSNQSVRMNFGVPQVLSLLHIHMSQNNKHVMFLGSPGDIC